MEKRCGICKEFKCITEFSNQAGKKDGKYYACKSCDIKKRNALSLTLRGTFQDIHKQMKYRSKKKKLEMDIDQEYLHSLWKEQGYTTNDTLKKKCPEVIARNSPWRLSPDRIDNKKGYVKGNVRLVCHIFNVARCDFSDEQLFEFIKISAQNI
tara:strand:+ start:5541 stop:5999 length:459 start_codon:yes stop_codon:yes gene_type:complete